ncbi:neutral zinc metallopeptidase [Kribbella sp. CA-253562]|uniref:neutral zinc metallopeptidase n=1 Tax=Kribbella sp. CA-253562 TaxID=3239942 RepID=UPI003D8BB152
MANDGAPGPGHFLPGGTGDQPASTPQTAGTTTSTAGTTPTAGSTPLAAPTPRLGADAPAGPPPLHGSRIGPPPPGDRAVAAFNARYRPEPIPFVPKKRSKLLVAGVVAGVLVLIAGLAFGGMKLLASFDDYVASPMGAPSVRGTDDPDAAKPAGDATPDAVVTAQNKLYSTGKLAAAGCKEPAYRPTTKDNVRAYYETLLGCLNKAWEPVVRKAGAEFNPPKLVIFDNGQETACGVHDDGLDTYCPADGGVLAMGWEDWPEDFADNRPLARVDLAVGLGYLYALHVQHLTGIYEAAGSMGDTAPNKAAALELDRRQALQAACLSAVFLGTEKATFPLRGELLAKYQWRTRNSGDEDAKDKVRDHGSRKNVEQWMSRGFGSGDPASCNTFVAAPAKVS